MTAAYLKREDISEEIKQQAIETPPDELRTSISVQAKVSLEQQVEIFQKRNGVACFSELHDSLLMWSHYSDGGRGFCLEFSTDNELFAKVEKVDYSDQMPRFDPAQILLLKEVPNIEKLYSTKSESWSYEREWRVIHQDSGVKYFYPGEILTGIYFGPRVDNAALEMICTIIQGQNPNVRFWKGERVEGKFELYFREFQYTNAVEAGKMKESS